MPSLFDKFIPFTHYLINSIPILSSIMNILPYILFILLCGGSIFFHSHSVNDGQIVSKWLFAEIGIGVWLLGISLKYGKTHIRQCNRPNIHLYYLAILLLCWGEALYGILQALHLCHAGSPHTVTGSFDNPAGFAACLCAGLPFAYPFLKSKQRKIRKTAYFLAGCIIVAVCLSQSRSGIFSMLIVAGTVSLPYLSSVKYKRTCATALFLILLAGGYLLKKDSADGRLLIWRCTCEMIKERPFTGWGKEGFAAHYMDYQAGYIQANPQSRFTMLADNVSHPFNEYLHVCLIGGIPLLILLAGIGLFLFYCYRRNPSWNGKTALLSLISIGLFSFFSYPFSYPFTWIIILFSCFVLIRQAHFRIKASNRTRRAGAICLACFTFTILYNQVHRIQAEQKWKNISDRALHGKGKEVFPLYEQLKVPLGKNPFFLYNYAAELYMEEQYEACLSVLKECRRHWADYDLEILFGETYYAQKQYAQAIAHFQTAADMCPVKFTPPYRIYRIYRDMGCNKKADSLARKILSKKIKIPSREIDRITRELNIYINR